MKVRWWPRIPLLLLRLWWLLVLLLLLVLVMVLLLPAILLRLLSYFVAGNRLTDAKHLPRHPASLSATLCQDCRGLLLIQRALSPRADRVLSPMRTQRGVPHLELVACGGELNASVSNDGKGHSECIPVLGGGRGEGQGDGG